MGVPTLAANAPPLVNAADADVCPLDAAAGAGDLCPVAGMGESLPAAGADDLCPTVGVGDLRSALVAGVTCNTLI